MQSRERQNIKVSADGSTTIYSSRFDQHYHSIFGAKVESELVFIELGLKYALSKFSEVNLLEMGFGTGLNSLLSLEYAEKTSKKISYTGLEAYPISEEMINQLSFDSSNLHKMEWGKEFLLRPNFSYRKLKTRLEDFETSAKFNLIYYDAFAPESQPELWSTEVFEKLYALMSDGGVLTTYCSKSYVQRNLKSAGFIVEKHPGPPRKREVLRVIKG